MNRREVEVVDGAGTTAVNENDGTGPLLRVRDLSVGYRDRRSTTDVVHQVSLDVAPGEFVAVVGESGSGKTTLAHAIIRLLPGNGHLTGGRVELAGDVLSALPERAMDRVRGARIGLVPQDPGSSLDPVRRIGAQVEDALRVHGLARGAQARQRTEEILGRAGLPDPAVTYRQYPHELSGGMRQRALLAMAMVCRPSLLIADEPTSALDVTVQRVVLDQLDTMIDEDGTAVLFITHDLAVAADRADRVLVMKDGRIVEVGPSAEVLGNPQHPYTAQLIDAAPSLHSARLTATTRSTAAPATALATTPEPILELREVTKDFVLPGGGTNRAVDGVSLTVAGGLTYALVGESGSGKSTTARIAMGLETPSAGTIRFDGNDVSNVKGAARRRLRARMQFVYQNPYASLDPRWPVDRIVAEPLQAFGVGDRASRRERVAELLEQVAIPAGLAKRKPAELSGGQRQRVAIARALATRPDLVVLDEPVSALDVSVQAQILQLLVNLQAELGLSYLFITHDLAVVRQLADEVGVMRRGQLVETGTTEEVFTSPRQPYTRELLDAIPGQAAAARVNQPEPAGGRSRGRSAGRC